MLNLIKSVFSSISSMKINEENEKQLDKKLHSITEYIINSNKQFEQWMELQNKNKLHSTLKAIYQKYCKNEGKVTEEDIASIIQFYTILLSNCKDELLIAKLVSDDLIFQLCLLTNVSSGSREELDAYRINLWKSYLGTINWEIVKYMVIDQKFIVFEECCRMFKQSLGMVQQTTIANIILNVMKKVNDIPFLWESMWKDEALISLFSNLIQKIGNLVKKKQNYFQVEEIILFFTDAAKEIKSEVIMKEITEFLHKQLAVLVDQIFSQTKQSEDGILTLSLSLLFPLFHSYKYENIIIQKIFLNIETIINWIRCSLTQQKPEIDLISRGIYLICRLTMSHESKLSVREDLEGKNIKMRQNIGQIIIQTLKYIKQKHEQHKQIINLVIIKYSLLSLFKLFIGSNTTNLNENCTREILELYLSFIEKFKEVFKKNQKWDYFIKWFEHDSNRVVEDLLHLPDHYETINQDEDRILLLTLEYIRNYRYMLIEKTSLTSKQIKQEKFYFSQFTSPGCAYKPGQIVNEEVPFICEAKFHHNYQQLNVSIVDDRQCFIIMYKNEEGSYKTILNVKFKAIEGFIYENQKESIAFGNSQQPKFIKILLKGVQEIILQFPNAKVHGNHFRQYLIKQKDFTRQRQMKYLRNWISRYEEDTRKTLQLI